VSGNVALLVRVGFSFSVVLGLMWVAARVLRNRTSGRPTDTVEVLARSQLGRGSSVTVLRIGDRALVLGVTERTITQLGEPITDLSTLKVEDVVREAVELPTREPDLPARLPGARRKAAPSAPVATAGEGALAGSILSPATWRLGMDALRERTVRRG
jgi:flagellar protein FliO/FliZ